MIWSTLAHPAPAAFGPFGPDASRRDEVVLAPPANRGLRIELEDGLFADGGTHGLEQVFALHCDPKLEVGTVGFRAGPITAGADRITARIVILVVLFAATMTCARAALVRELHRLDVHVRAGGPPTRPVLLCNPWSGGGKVGFNYSSTDTVLTLIDLNGDGLPDKVFKAGGGQVYFRLNRSGPSGTTVFGPPIPIPSLTALGQETATRITAGPELYLVANVIYNHAETFTTS